MNTFDDYRIKAYLRKTYLKAALTENSKNLPLQYCRLLLDKEIRLTYLFWFVRLKLILAVSESGFYTHVYALKLIMFVSATTYLLQVQIPQLALFVPTVHLVYSIQIHQIVLDTYSAGIPSRTIRSVMEI